MDHLYKTGLGTSEAPESPVSLRSCLSSPSLGIKAHGTRVVLSVTASDQLGQKIEPWYLTYTIFLLWLLDHFIASPSSFSYVIEERGIYLWRLPFSHH